MTIPELMYGAWRYDFSGHLINDLTHMHAEARGWASVGKPFAAIPNGHSAWSMVWSFLGIIFGLVARIVG